MTPKALIVEDDAAVRNTLDKVLTSSGVHSTLTASGEEAVKALENESFDAVLLDLNLDGMDGFEVIHALRDAGNQTPIMVVSGRTEDVDMLYSLEIGADDYITKPFNILELKARIRALIRRSSMPVAGAPKSGKLVRGQIEIDPERRSAKRFGENVELTVKEFDLIELLMRNPGKVYSRENLLDLVWGYEYQGDIRTVDVHIRRLREKLEKQPNSPEYIITKWGVGYYFAES